MYPEPVSLTVAPGGPLLAERVSEKGASSALISSASWLSSEMLVASVAGSLCAEPPVPVDSVSVSSAAPSRACGTCSPPLATNFTASWVLVLSTPTSPITEPSRRSWAPEPDPPPPHSKAASTLPPPTGVRSTPARACNRLMNPILPSNAELSITPDACPAVWQGTPCLPVLAHSVSVMLIVSEAAPVNAPVLVLPRHLITDFPATAIVAVLPVPSRPPFTNPGVHSSSPVCETLLVMHLLLV